MARRKSKQKVSHGLVAMSSAAVLAVYGAGYVRTRPAADRLAQQALAREGNRDAPPPVPAREVALHAPESTPAAPTAPAHPDPEPPKAAPATPNVSVAPPQPAPDRPAKVPNVVAKSEAPAPAPVPTSVSPATAPVTPAVSPVPETQPTVSAPAPAPAASVAATPVIAPSSPAPAPAPTAPATSVWKDGKYTAWGTCRHGDIQATVTIQGGRIVSAEISDCQTRYPCDIVDKLPPQVVKRQTANVDRLGGATESSDAFYGAVYYALQQAK